MPFGGAVPMFFAGRSIHGIAGSQGGLRRLRSDASFSFENIEDLLAGVCVPIRTCAIFKVNDEQLDAFLALGDYYVL